MATKYWRVGGTNTWSSTANWSNISPTGATGAAIPVVGDDVVISNVGQTAGTINIGATATAKLNSWTVIGGTWTVAGATQVNIAGTFDCRNVTWTNTGVLSLQGTGGSYDINASGTTFSCAVTLNAFIVASSSFNLLSAFTTGATQTTTLTAGTLILNNFTWTTGITFRDALWFTQEEYDALTPENILTLQQERFDNWEAIVNSPPTESSDGIDV